MSDATDLTAFKTTALANNDMFAKMMAETDNLANTGGNTRRISIRGGRFREIVGGEQIRVNSSGSMDVVILRISGINRTYFDGPYDADKSEAPACWSTNQETPSADVPDETRQSPSCRDCKMNIKGSGQGDSRACRFSIRTAICLPDNFDNVYQFQIPATSIFGEAKGAQMPIQAYAKYLKANGLAMAALVTQMSFDEDSETPKLYFKPVRPLDEEELSLAVEAYGTEAAETAATLTVFKKDAADAEDKPKPKPEPKPKPKPEPETVAADDGKDDGEDDDADAEAAATARKAARAKARAAEDAADDAEAEAQAKAKAKAKANATAALADDTDTVEDAEIADEPKKVARKKPSAKADAAVAEVLSGWD
jgi:hypothetical protein